VNRNEFEKVIYFIGKGFVFLPNFFQLLSLGIQHVSLLPFLYTKREQQPNHLLKYERGALP
jgi:hypothetical protein